MHLGSLQEVIDQYIHDGQSVALEGFTVSPEQTADMAAYVRGEMTLDDVLARTNARYGRRAV